MDVLVWCDALADWVAANEEPTFQNVEVCPRRPAPAPQPVAPPASAQRERQPAATKRRTQRIAVKPLVSPKPPGFHPTREGTNSGPYSHEEIVQMFATGAVSRAGLLWREGLSAWAAGRRAIQLPSNSSLAPSATEISTSQPRADHYSAKRSRHRPTRVCRTFVRHHLRGATPQRGRRKRFCHGADGCGHLLCDDSPPQKSRRQALALGRHLCPVRKLPRHPYMPLRSRGLYALQAMKARPESPPASVQPLLFVAFGSHFQ